MSYNFEKRNSEVPRNNLEEVLLRWRNLGIFLGSETIFREEANGNFKDKALIYTSRITEGLGANMLYAHEIFRYLVGDLSEQFSGEGKVYFKNFIPSCFALEVYSYPDTEPYIYLSTLGRYLGDENIRERILVVSISESSASLSEERPDSYVEYLIDKLRVQKPVSV
jgi:hypothetical protein